jgi:hypothetical protein
MPRLSDEALRERIGKLGILCVRRAQGTSEGQIAQELGFVDSSGVPSAQVMYERLQEWGLPNWVVKPDDSNERAGFTENKGKKRKAQHSGKAQEHQVEVLPAPSRAQHLFIRDLARLENYLRELPNLREERRGERFFSYSKDNINRQLALQNFLIEVHGFDELPYTSSAHPKSATVTPWEGLTYLIAVHMLMNESADPLIDALHPRPQEVDRAELYKDKHGIVTMLKTTAKQLAKVVRGIKVRRGHHSGEVSEEEVWMYWFQIYPLVNKGYSNEEIYKKLKEHYLDEAGRFRGKGYTLEDVKRLRKLNLQPPSDFEARFPDPPPSSDLNWPPPFYD